MQRNVLRSRGTRVARIGGQLVSHNRHSPPNCKPHCALKTPADLGDAARFPVSETADTGMQCGSIRGRVQWARPIPPHPAMPRMVCCWLLVSQNQIRLSLTVVVVEVRISRAGNTAAIPEGPPDARIWPHATGKICSKRAQGVLKMCPGCLEAQASRRPDV